MDWNPAIERHREALLRIVMMLMAMARTAESAAGLPILVRCIVLWWLRQAESVATSFVLATAYELGVLTDPPAQSSDHSRRFAEGARAADALRLALEFRMLAGMLNRLVALIPERRPGRIRLRRFNSDCAGLFTLDFAPGHFPLEGRAANRVLTLRLEPGAWRRFRASWALSFQSLEGLSESNRHQENPT